jgi:hypothetical protein
VLAMVSVRQGCKTNAGLLLHWNVSWSDSAAEGIISRRLGAVSLEQSTNCTRSSSLSALGPNMPFWLSFQFSKSTDVVLFLVPMFSGLQVRPNPNKNIEGLNSFLQQFNLTKFPFIVSCKATAYVTAQHRRCSTSHGT